MKPRRGAVKPQKAPSFTLGKAAKRPQATRPQLGAKKQPSVRTSGPAQSKVKGPAVY